MGELSSGKMTEEFGRRSHESPVSSSGAPACLAFSVSPLIRESGMTFMAEDPTMEA